MPPRERAQLKRRSVRASVSAAASGGRVTAAHLFARPAHPLDLHIVPRWTCLPVLSSHAFLCSLRVHSGLSMIWSINFSSSALVSVEL